MLTREQALDLAEAQLRAEGSPWSARHATRSERFSLWVVSYVDPFRPGEPLAGGGLVVTDEGDAHELGSAPGSLDDLMIVLGRWPGADVWAREGEGLALLADEDLAEAVDLAAWAEARRRERGGPAASE